MGNAPKAEARKRRTTRIVIVDDHPMIREHVALVIRGESDLELCGEAGGRAEAQQVIAQTKPHLVIVDLSLKDSYGLDLIKDIRQQHPEVRILVLSMHEESVYAQRALDAGARGYITKQEATRNIIDAIREVSRGGRYLSSEMVEQLSRIISPERRYSAGGQIAYLSDRELQVFELIGRGYIMRQIAERLGLDVKTVETYQARLRSKLGQGDAHDLRQTAIRWVATGQLSIGRSRE